MTQCLGICSSGPAASSSPVISNVGPHRKRTVKLVRPSEDMSRYRDEFALRVRLFNPRGQYPRGTYANENSLYIADDEIVFSAVFAKPYDQLTSNFPYSEMVWATPQEVRFWASILLCEDADGPKILLYPECLTFALLDSQSLDLRDADTQFQLRRLVIDEVETRGEKSLPRHLFENNVNLVRQAEFFNKIADTDHILLRGITCLIKCDMLSRYYEFTEEATIVGFISLEASFGLVVNLLKARGMENPSAADAGRWLDDTFNRPLGIDPGERKYFEELYEQRVITMHPSSRYGDCPYAPLAVDDLFDLRRDLREVFAYLTSGCHGPEFSRRVKESGMK